MNRDSLKLYDVDILPLGFCCKNKLQRFAIAARNKTQAHKIAVDCICLSIPTSTEADWFVKAVTLVKDYKL